MHPVVLFGLLDLGDRYRSWQAVLSRIDGHQLEHVTDKVRVVPYDLWQINFGDLIPNLSYDKNVRGTLLKGNRCTQCVLFGLLDLGGTAVGRQSCQELTAIN